MATPYISPVADVALTTVAQSWHESNAARYVHSRLPKARINGLRSGYSGVLTYKIPNLDNFLLKSGTGRAWRPGMDLRDARAFGESTVSIELMSEANDPRVFPMPRGGQRNRMADAENVTAGEMSILYSRRDQELYNVLKTNALYGNGAGAALKWGGTEAFALPDTTGDQDPIGNINAQINAIRYWRQGVPNLRLVAICDRLTLTYLQSKPAYHGAGAGATGGGSGAGSPGFVPESQMVSTLKSIHGFDDVWIMDLPMDSVALGQTSAPTFIAAAPFFWLGLVAAGDVDLRTSTDFGPDGALALAEDFSPFVDVIEDAPKESILYVGKDEFGLVVPRSSGLMGRCFTDYSGA